MCRAPASRKPRRQATVTRSPTRWTETSPVPFTELATAGAEQRQAGPRAADTLRHSAPSVRSETLRAVVLNLLPAGKLLHAGVLAQQSDVRNSGVTPGPPPCHLSVGSRSFFEPGGVVQLFGDRKFGKHWSWLDSGVKLFRRMNVGGTAFWSVKRRQGGRVNARGAN
ncbi:hypothetical protein EYF80_016653 [Liparis tanakae]|uniref:Uncharacterized protein n=1 Tax=Liparis tanakae TaxID=230148 RepID=A0A4Z2I574_9TELE|nr:hypothetical protein EYF80_016653 [Liparis tanakae]